MIRARIGHRFSQHSTALAFAVGLLLAARGTAIAADQQLPAQQATMLLFKSLTFDDNIARGRSELRIGVLSAKSSEASAKRAREVAASIGKVSHLRVRGLKLSGVHLSIVDKSSTDSMLASSGVNVLYLGPGLGDIAYLCQLAQKRHMLVISGEPEHASTCSAITVVQRGRKPTILVNRPAAKEQGAALNDQFLKIAQVVK